MTSFFSIHFCHTVATKSTMPRDTQSNSGSPGSSSSERSDDIVVTLVANVVQVGLAVVASYYLSSWITSKLQKSQMEVATNNPARRRLEEMLRRQGKEMPEITAYESMIAEDVVDPEDLNVSFQDIGGLERIKQELWQLAVLPLKRPDLFEDNKLVQSPRGILLYGRPGTGKTMLAKALAKEAEAVFVEVKLSKIMDKWFGESNKLIAATFGLAQKLAPSIIFVDELDTFLNPRDGFENSASATIKSEFLVLWDGMTTKDGVLVLGATNRPHNVDKAILRRLPRTFEVPVPGVASRQQILSLLLEDQNMDDSVKAYMGELVKRTVGYTGSDLKELCRAAASGPIHEMVSEASKQAVAAGSGGGMKKPMLDAIKKSTIRPLSKMDFVRALQKVKRTGQAAHSYGQGVEREQEAEKVSQDKIVEEAMMRRAMSLFRAMATIEQSKDSSNEDEIPNLDEAV